MGSAKKGAKLEIPPQLLAKRYSFPLSSGGCLANVIVVPPRKRNCQRYDRKEEEDDRKRLSRFSLLLSDHLARTVRSQGLNLVAQEWRYCGEPEG